MKVSAMILACVWTAFALVQPAIAVQKKLACSAQTAAIAQLQSNVDRTMAFCSYWLLAASYKTDDPFGEMDIATITKACQCVVANPALITKKPTQTVTPLAQQNAACSPDDSAINAVKSGFKSPAQFCSYYTANKRLRSPVLNVVPVKVSSACACASKTPSLFSAAAATATPAASAASQDSATTIVAAVISASTTLSAKPTVPASVKKAAISNLIPAAQSAQAFINSDSSIYGVSSTNFNYPTVLLDYSSLISSISCSASGLTIKFSNANAQLQARLAWKGLSQVLFVTTSSSCASGGANYFFLGTSLASSAMTGIITVKGTSKSFSDVTGTYTLNFASGQGVSQLAAAKSVPKSKAAQLSIASFSQSISSMQANAVTSSPWGSQVLLYSWLPSVAADPSSKFSKALDAFGKSKSVLRNTKVSSGVSMYCVDCAVSGNLAYTGSYRSSANAKRLTMSLSGSLQSNFQVGINAFAQQNATTTIPIGEIALPSFQMENLLTVYPSIRIDLIATVNIKTPGQLLLGTKASWSAVNVTIDTTSTQATLSGGQPSMTYPFSASGPATGDYKIEARATLQLKYGASGVSTQTISFMDARSLAASSSMSTNGCSNISWDLNGGWSDTANAGMSSSLTLQDGTAAQDSVCAADSAAATTTAAPSTSSAVSTTSSVTPPTTSAAQMSTTSSVASTSAATTASSASPSVILSTSTSSTVVIVTTSSSSSTTMSTTTSFVPTSVSSTSTSITTQATTTSVQAVVTSSSPAPTASSAPVVTNPNCVPNQYTYISTDSPSQLWQMNSTLGYTSYYQYNTAASMADCISQCIAYGSNCAGATWIQSGMSAQNCFYNPSSAFSNPTNLANAGLTGFSAIRMDGNSCISTTAPACPAADQSTYRSISGATYKVQCNYQYTQNLLAYVDVTGGYAECVSTCESVADCMSVSYSHDGSLASPTCALYGSGNGSATSSSLSYSVDSAVMIKG